ncbi:MAG: hypothetical protein HY959_04170 [Ignavibacteriae bacterium]|nr:hypothetical protein [Ignavibacteriota bacterium]
MIKFSIVVLIFALIIPGISIPQTNTEIGYGFQGDLSVAFLQLKISGSLDFDFINFNKTLYLGTRLSAEHYTKSKLDSKNYDSPYTDLDVLAKITVSTPYVEINLGFGASHHSTDIDLMLINSPIKYLYPDYTGWYGKFSGDVKFKIYRDYFGLLLKFAGSKESSIGLGIFFGGNSRHP